MTNLTNIKHNMTGEVWMVKFIEYFQMLMPEVRDGLDWTAIHQMFVDGMHPLDAAVKSTNIEM